MKKCSFNIFRQWERKKACMGMYVRKIQSFMWEQGVDWNGWHTNLSFASHTGEVCEQQIHSLSNRYFSNTFETHGECLDDTSLLTLMTSVKGILNFRPLTAKFLNDSINLQPLLTRNILNMKSRLVLPPPGEFGKPHMYYRSCRQHIQYIANEVWFCWKKDQLQSLQECQK